MYKNILLFAFLLSCVFLTAQKTPVPNLYYSLPDTVKAVSFYNEIRVSSDAVAKRGVYIAGGFSGGFVGLEFNKPAKRKIVFAIAGFDKTNSKPVTDRITLLASGEDVVTRSAGKSGGVQSAFPYEWNPGTTYPFLITALADSAAAETIYTAYCFLPELKKWKLIASFKVSGNGKTFSELHAFHEYTIAANGRMEEAGMGGNQWIQDERGKWTELTRGWISDNTAGAAGFSRPAKGQQPVINWTANADSAVQAEKDRSAIIRAIREQREDTTGSRDGVYYRIMKEGTGRFVSVSDTITVFYKGSLLLNGSVFDQTREKPATFPLSRLIKGWQLALPACKVGGKIRIIIPSGLAYTIRSRSKAIPPNSVLVFDIEVLAAKSAG